MEVILSLIISICKAMLKSSYVYRFKTLKLNALRWISGDDKRYCPFPLIRKTNIVGRVCYITTKIKLVRWPWASEGSVSSHSNRPELCIDRIHAVLKEPCSFFLTGSFCWVLRLLFVSFKFWRKLNYLGRCGNEKVTFNFYVYKYKQMWNCLQQPRSLHIWRHNAGTQRTLGLVEHYYILYRFLYRPTGHK